MRSFLLSATLAVASLLIAACGGDPAGSSPRKIAIAGARLEPGPGKPALDYSIVIVEDGKFKAVGHQTSVPLPKDAEIVNGLDHTLTPLEPTTVIEPGQPANLEMKGPRGSRTMREGLWR